MDGEATEKLKPSPLMLSTSVMVAVAFVTALEVTTSAEAAAVVVPGTAIPVTRSV